MTYSSSLARMQFDRLVQDLHSLGARPTAEFITELCNQIGGHPAATRLLIEYQRRLTPEMLRATGGDRFPARPLRKVPALTEVARR